MIVVLTAHNFLLQRDEAYASAVLVARNVASDLETEVARVESGLRVLASSPELRRGDFAAFRHRASETAGFQNVTRYMLTDGSGQPLVDTHPPYEQVRVLHNESLAPRTVDPKNQAVVPSLTRDVLTYGHVVTIGVPVQLANAQSMVLRAEINTDQVDKAIRRQVLREGWIAAVIDARGTILARTRDAQRYVGQQTTPLMLDEISRRMQGTLESTTKDGQAVLTAFTRVPRTGWIVAVGVPKADLTGALHRALVFLLVVGAFSIGTGLWLASRSARLLARSVQDLVEPALALGCGRPLAVQPTQLREARAVGDALVQASLMLANAEHRAHHDALTGLGNRVLFEQVAKELHIKASREHQSLAVLLIDLDGFKAVNDTHGHAAGDLVLKIAAERIVSHTRRADIRARLGGDEFAVLLCDTSAEDARQVGDKLLTALSKPYPDVVPAISASIGISVFPAQGPTVEQMVEFADQALYSAKRQGKNVIEIAPEQVIWPIGSPTAGTPR